MNNPNNFWIEWSETQTGLEKLSCKLEGQHYVGFLEWHEKLKKMEL